MSEILVAENYPISNISDTTFLSADAESAQAVIAVEAIGSIVANDFLLIGEKGQETGQIAKVNSVSGLNVTLNANLTVKHYRNEKVTKLRADQVKFYRATNADGTVPVNGDFSTVATTSIRADQIFTEYVDSVGGSGYWYKYTFVNSHTSSETSLDDAVPVRGGNFGYYVTSEQVKQEAGMSNNRWLSDTLVFDKLQFAQSEINSSLVIAGYQLPFTTVPELVKNAVLLLAAGYLLTAEYGPEFEGLNKDGNIKIQQAREIIANLIASKSQLVDGNGTIIQTTGLMRGYPDNNAATNTPSEDFSFRITDRY